MNLKCYSSWCSLGLGLGLGLGRGIGIGIDIALALALALALAFSLALALALALASADAYMNGFEGSSRNIASYTRCKFECAMRCNVHVERTHVNTHAF